MANIKEIVNFLESIAPKSLQEEYDNSGLLTGNIDHKVHNVLVSLDVTEEVIEEAIKKQCGLVIAHHPVIFKGLKSITGKNDIERSVIKAIKNDIAIYAIHTNLDNVKTGVNKKIGEVLGLTNLEILSPKKHVLSKLTTFVPKDASNKVLTALSDAGAGNIGEYKKCSFRIEGKGTFEPSDSANPYIGEKNKLEEVVEDRIEVIFPSYKEKEVLIALNKAHPYEEVAYYLHLLENYDQEVGSGMTGELNLEMTANEFIQHLKKQMNLEVVKHTKKPGKKIKKVAYCGGSGSFLISTAIKKQADVYITADIKYHDFFMAENKIWLMDIGHYESEKFTKELIYEFLREKFANIAINLSEINTNPIRYS